MDKSIVEGYSQPLNFLVGGLVYSPISKNMRQSRIGSLFFEFRGGKKLNETKHFLFISP